MRESTNRSSTSVHSISSGKAVVTSVEEKGEELKRQVPSVSKRKDARYSGLLSNRAKTAEIGQKELPEVKTYVTSGKGKAPSPCGGKGKNAES